MEETKSEKKVLRCGTRGSRLALAQTQTVIGLLQEKHPEISVEPVIIETEGDQIPDRPLYELGGKGLFVEKIEDALLRGDIDFAVHSAKDLPINLREQFLIAAVPERGDRADVLVTRAGTVPPQTNGAENKADFVLGTSSQRRIVMAKANLPGCEIRTLRGNITTRLQRLRNGDFDGILLAAAGLDRLKPDLSGLTVQRMDPTKFIPAAGQGILVCEAVRRTEAVRLLRSINHPGTQALLETERQLMCLLEADCRSAAGVCADYTDAGNLLISAFYQQPTVYQSEPDMRHIHEALRELAGVLLKQGKTI